jgi:hypothetical protein
VRVLRLEREEFLRDYWPGLYRPGEHVAAFGPTQRAGKTWLLFQLLQATNTEQLRATAFCMKVRDKTVSSWTKKLEYREIPEWPPAEWPWSKPRGYCLWPRHTMQPDIDNAHLHDEYRKAMLAEYKRGNSILMLDEVYGIVGELKLQEELLAILTRGGGMGCGAWIASQKPSGTQQVPLRRIGRRYRPGRDRGSDPLSPQV